MQLASEIGKDVQALDELKEPIIKFVEHYDLSNRERDVLALLVHQVVSADDIAEQLGISRNTVRIHLKNINTKVRTNSKSELLGRFLEFTIQSSSDQNSVTLGRELHILITDDDRSYFELIKKATSSQNGSFQHQFHWTSNGREMLDYLDKVKRKEESCPRPDLILLDLNMPTMNGFQALERLKTDPQLMEIPVVVFTSSENQSDIANIYSLGGNSYVTKPGDYNELKQTMKGILNYWSSIGALPKK